MYIVNTMSESMIRILNRTREYLKQIPKELHSSEYFLLMDKITEYVIIVLIQLCEI